MLISATALQVKRGQDLNEHANFENFGRSLLTLFRIATADAWTGIMVDASVQPPHCDEAIGECGTVAAPLYIMSFSILIGQIVLNLFTTIVIETFEEMDEVRPFSPLILCSSCPCCIGYQKKHALVRKRRFL